MWVNVASRVAASMNAKPANGRVVSFLTTGNVPPRKRPRFSVYSALRDLARALREAATR